MSKVSKLGLIFFCPHKNGGLLWVDRDLLFSAISWEERLTVNEACKGRMTHLPCFVVVLRVKVLKLLMNLILSLHLSPVIPKMVFFFFIKVRFSGLSLNPTWKNAVSSWSTTLRWSSLDWVARINSSWMAYASGILLKTGSRALVRSPLGWFRSHC